MADVFGTGHNLQLRKVCFGYVDNFDGLLNTVNYHYQNAGSCLARGAQQIKPCGVAVKHAVSKRRADSIMLAS